MKYTDIIGFLIFIAIVLSAVWALRVIYQETLTRAKPQEPYIWQREGAKGVMYVDPQVIPRVKQIKGGKS